MRTKYIVTILMFCSISLLHAQVRVVDNKGTLKTISVSGIQNWVLTDAYVLDQLVINNDKIYQANGAISASTPFLEGTTGATWTEISASTIVPLWVNNTNGGVYAINDIINYNGNLYRNLTGANTNTTPDTDTTNWREAIILDGNNTFAVIAGNKPGATPSSPVTGAPASPVSGDTVTEIYDDYIVNYTYNGATWVSIAYTRGANDRHFADETTVSPVIPGAPTVVEMQTYATGLSLINTVVYYTGTDTATDNPTYVYHADNSGVVTLIEKPSSGSGATLTQGSVAFAGASGDLTEDNSNLFYDDANNSLGVGTNTPDVSAVLELLSTNAGFLPPRLNKAQMEAIPSPAEGLVVYSYDCYPRGLFVYNSTNWVNTSTGDICLEEGIISSSGLDCASATVIGELPFGYPANNVIVNIPYTGGNGGGYDTVAVASTGVTGLVATTQAGRLVSGDGSIIFTISGTSSAAGTANFNITLGGQSCTLSLTVIDPNVNSNFSYIFQSGDITNTINDGVSLTGPSGNLRAIKLSADKTKLWVGDRDDVYQYTLSTPGDVTTATLDGTWATVFPSSTNAVLGIDVSPDGTKMALTNFNGEITEYDLTTTNDVITTTPTAGITFDVTPQTTGGAGIRATSFIYSKDGTTAFVIGNYIDTVFEYNLPIPYSFAGMGYSGNSFNVATQENVPYGLALNDQGDKLFLLGAGQNTIFEYDLPTANTIAGMTYNGLSFPLTGIIASNASQVTISGDKMLFFRAGNATIFSTTVSVNPSSIIADTSFTGLMGTLFNVGDTIIISGTAFNNGIVTVKEVIDANTIIVEEVIVTETFVVSTLTKQF